MRNLCIALVAVFTLTGCFFSKMTSGNKSAGSGFLKDYSKMKRIPGTPDSRLYIDPNFNLQSYDKIIIEPIVVSLQKNQRTNPETLAQLTRHFRQQFIDTIKEHFVIVNDPGPGVLRFRAAIVKIDPVTPRNGIHKDVFADKTLNITNSDIEAEFIDASNNVRMISVIDRQVGRMYKQPSNDWRHIRETLSFWSRQMLRRMKPSRR